MKKVIQEQQFTKPQANSGGLLKIKGLIKHSRLVLCRYKTFSLKNSTLYKIKLKRNKKKNLF